MNTLNKILIILSLGIASVSFAQTTDKNFFDLDKTKINLNYKAETKVGLKFNWNSDHLGNKLNNPMKYTYKTDYGLNINKYSKFSIIGEGNVIQQNFSLFQYNQPIYNRNQSFLLGYNYNSKFLNVTMSYNYKEINNGVNNPDNRILRIDLSSKL